VASEEGVGRVSVFYQCRPGVLEHNPRPKSLAPLVSPTYLVVLWLLTANEIACVDVKERRHDRVLGTAAAATLKGGQLVQPIDSGHMADERSTIGLHCHASLLGISQCGGNKRRKRIDSISQRIEGGNFSS